MAAIKGDGLQTGGLREKQKKKNAEKWKSGLLLFKGKGQTVRLELVASV